MSGVPSAADGVELAGLGPRRLRSGHLAIVRITWVRSAIAAREARMTPFAPLGGSRWTCRTYGHIAAS
jgi:hypothetical protein